MRLLPLFFCTLIILASLVLWPHNDLVISGWFYKTDGGFYLADCTFCLVMHWLAYYGARAIGIALACITPYTYLRSKPLWKIDAKGWLFLLLALLIAPGLVGNVILKDQWGRARPRTVTEFGGSNIFSAPMIVQKENRPNGSFISGDAAFGFYLTSLAYVFPPRARRKISRRAFWGGMAAGLAFGATRIVMGAHFFSDVLFAGFFMLATMAALHAVIYGWRNTRDYWRDWFFQKQ